uniref:NADH-ubiquinone oxidoreductase chain 4 n=1 Tax=Arctonoe vittata TaxID=862921 RepID=A0A8F2JE18_9ANNE|nr:NADH dehydrogenase subunit 4 [Arctonoe vittata]
MLNLLFPMFLMFFISMNPLYSWFSLATAFFLLTFLSMMELWAPFLDLILFNSFTMSDLMSSGLISLSLWISGLMILASVKINQMKRNPRSFLVAVTLLSMILILSFMVSDLMSFYIMFEASLIPTLMLVLGWGYQPERLQAGMYLMLYTICASLPLLMNLMFIYFNEGSLHMGLSFFYSSLMNNSMLPYWWALTIMAFLVKMPMFIFHLWLPKAHVEAPIAGSMILAGLLLKLGGYGLIRISLFMPHLMFKISPMCNSVALWGGVLTSFICLRQSDIKSLIAYSSVGHMSLVILGISLTSSWGWKGALIMMIAHGLCSSCMFALANMNYESTSTRSMFLTKGILSIFPAISFWWFILSICNMAAPPSINLFGEITLINSALWASFFYMIPLGLCSFLAAAYSLLLFTSTNHGSAPPFLNTQTIMSPQFYTTSMLHAGPIFLLIMSSEIISQWV